MSWHVGEEKASTSKHGTLIMGGGIRLGTLHMKPGTLSTKQGTRDRTQERMKASGYSFGGAVLHFPEISCILLFLGRKLAYDEEKRKESDKWDEHITKEVS